MIALILWLMIVPPLAKAQSDEAQIKAEIEKLFIGMKAADSTAVRSAFHDQVTLATVYRDKENAVKLRRESSVNDFIRSVGTQRADVLNEEIWGLIIQRDGDFAQAWCDYAFYVGKKFSHCGVDAFQFIKTNAGWKIFHLADTRRVADCVIPDGIQAKYKN
ncbi:MAG: nuclear transport factor 2 family protein [Cyclobacteriaceae bacterium]|nr:nuclear transport factor 2 family protein [Cyclobacteriaceae bacterium]